MIEVKEGEPKRDGKYICWVNPEYNLGRADVIFLMWIGGVWSYPLSSEKYRDHVYQFAGPVPVLRLED